MIRALHARADLVDLGKIRRRFRVKIDLGEFTGLWRWIEGLREDGRLEGEGGDDG